MKVTIELECNNAAFEDSITSEVARILETVPNKLQRAILDNPSSALGFHAEHPLRDVNGNTVGKLTVREETER